MRQRVVAEVGRLTKLGEIVTNLAIAFGYVLPNDALYGNAVSLGARVVTDILEGNFSTSEMRDLDFNEFLKSKAKIAALVCAMFFIICLTISNQLGFRERAIKILTGEEPLNEERQNKLFIAFRAFCDLTATNCKAIGTSFAFAKLMKQFTSSQISLISGLSPFLLSLFDQYVLLGGDKHGFKFFIKGIGGLILSLLVAVTVYAITYAIDPEQAPLTTIAAWLATFISTTAYLSAVRANLIKGLFHSANVGEKQPLLPIEDKKGDRKITYKNGMDCCLAGFFKFDSAEKEKTNPSVTDGSNANTPELK